MWPQCIGIHLQDDGGNLSLIHNPPLASPPPIILFYRLSDLARCAAHTLPCCWFFIDKAKDKQLFTYFSSTASTPYSNCGFADIDQRSVVACVEGFFIFF